MTEAKPVLGIIGGGGKLGSALGWRWAKAGYRVLLGSRDAMRAQEAATKLTRGRELSIEGCSNHAAAEQAQLVIMTVPFAAQADTLKEISSLLTGKILVDTTVPLVPPKVMRVQLPPEDSAAVRAQMLLGDSVTVVSAFHNVAAHRLATDQTIDCDVLVFGDKKEARDSVVLLADHAGLRGIHGGPLANSAAAEALTSVLIFVNRVYGVDGAGIRITGQLTQPAR